MNNCRALQLAPRHLHDGSLAFTPKQIRNLLLHRQSCSTRRYLRVIYFSAQDVSPNYKHKHVPFQRDCDLTLYRLHWQKTGGKRRRRKGIRSDNAPELHTIREVCDLSQEPHPVPIPSAAQHTKLTGAALLSCKLRLAGLSKGGSLNQAGDFSPFQLNQTQGLIIFQCPAKSHLGPTFFPAIFSRCIFQFSVSKPTLPTGKCKTSPSAERVFSQGRAVTWRSSSRHAAESKQQFGGNSWMRSANPAGSWSPGECLSKDTPRLPRQRLQPVIPQRPGKAAHGGSKEHRYCRILATAAVRKVLKHEEEAVFASL